MKKFIIYFSLLLISSAGFAQQNESVFERENVIDFSNIQRTEKLERLYQESEILNKTGTPEQINANRLALKAAWQEVNPEVAALYSEGGKDEIIQVANNIASSSEYSTSRRPEVYPNTVEVFRGPVDYFDMKTAANGDIYIASASWNDPTIDVRVSKDNGNSWTIYKTITTPHNVKKLQLILLTGIGDEYVNVYFMTEDNKLNLHSSKIDWGGGDHQVVYNSIGEIKEFSVAYTTEASTGLQRVFLLYVKKSDNSLRQARTAPGGYGLSFQDDKVVTSLNVKNPHISYGHDGSVYRIYVRNGAIYLEVNSNYLDPGSNTQGSSVASEPDVEHIEPVIAASRKPIASDNVIVVASYRTRGTSDPYRQAVYKRTNNQRFNLLFQSDHIATYSLVTPSVYVRNEAGNEIIRTSYVKRELGGQREDGIGYSHTYNGTDMEQSEALTDPTRDTYKAVIGETRDGKVCMAYVPLYLGEPEGIYFTSPNVLNVQNQIIGGLSVYPVPAKETVTVSAASVINKIKVISILGQTVMEISANQNETTIDTSILSQGIYFLEIYSEGKSEIRKIIKN